MSEKWYQYYLNKVRESYSDNIIVIDDDNLGSFGGIDQSLSADFLIHHYRNEFSLRLFLNKNTGKRIIIFKPSEIDYLPYDIEAISLLIRWQLKEIFPKLHMPTVKKYPFHDFQVIYDNYRLIEKSLGEAGELETVHLIEEWLKKPFDRREALELDELLDKIQTLLNKDAIDWRSVAPIWGRISYLKYLLEGNHDNDLDEIDKKMNLFFKDHIFGSYNNLFYESYINGPVTIDKVLHYIGHQPGDRKVLICFDGMGFQEWCCLKNYLVDKGIEKFKENAVYALLPTLTKISRKALFSGIKSIGDMISEDSGFQRHVRGNWHEGADKSQKVIINAPVKWIPEYLEYDYLGIIINLVDNIAHSTILVSEGKRRMQSSLISVLQETEIAKIIGEFLINGYSVYIGSDHGSVWCRGNGYQAEKYLVEDHAKRALVYPNRILAEEFCRGKDVLIYEDHTVTGESIIVFPPHRMMFAKVNDLMITHGGLHIEEVIVPFVEVLK